MLNTEGADGKPSGGRSAHDHIRRPARPHIQSPLSVVTPPKTQDLASNVIVRRVCFSSSGYSSLGLPELLGIRYHLGTSCVSDESLSTMAPPEPILNDLPPIQRHITTHNSSGKAILSTALPSEPKWQPIADGANFFLAYTTRTFPVSLHEDAPGAVPNDIQNYEKDLNSPPGLSIAQGLSSKLSRVMLY